jgi:hypothetical protein
MMTRKKEQEVMAEWKKVADMRGAWALETPSTHIILVSDEQFLNIAEHPDEALESMFPGRSDEKISLREHCRRAAESGADKMRVAYDYFFGGTERSLYPDMPAFQDALKKIHDVAAEYGIGLEPSVLTPLELGIGFQERTDESGRWMHYAEDMRDPETGRYSIQMWQHVQWCNNKGPTPVELVGARAFAFHEEPVPGTPFYVVEPDKIIELAPPQIEDLGVVTGGGREFTARRVRVWGDDQINDDGADRVFVVLLYRTVEMDYFSPEAEQFLHDLAHDYDESGIKLTGIYSDEAHIQQDWRYHQHLDGGQFTVRYVSTNFERAFAESYGEEYADFAKYLIYFIYAQHHFAPTHAPKLPIQHVMGATPRDIYRTFLLRSRYYGLLEHGIVKLLVDARNEIEKLNGRQMDMFYHATWAESPTCDMWAVNDAETWWSSNEHRRKYEYTSDFMWSNTVHQAAAACMDYFAWNEFLTGGNVDTPEGGFSDRNYYGRALANSLAVLNRRPRSSAGMWGMPPEVRKRMIAVNEVYGSIGHPTFGGAQDYAPCEQDVLFTYPLDLVAVEERFGSWIVQYGYANYASAEKIVEYGEVTEDGRLKLKDRFYRALCILFDPFPSPQFLTLIKKFVERGGSVIWSGVPPMLDSKGEDVREDFLQEIFGVKLTKAQGEAGVSMESGSWLDADPVESGAYVLGQAFPGRVVAFEGILSDVESMPILTGMLVDRVYPVEKAEDARVVARIGDQIVGTVRTSAANGKAVFLGFRPRDDQSQSLGYDVRSWFEILRAIGAYPGSDHPVAVSRTTNYLASRFPNGAVAICPHYRTHPESWYGSFFRDPERDAAIVAQNPPPDDAIILENFRVATYTVTYQGGHAVTFRVEAGHLIAFSGVASSQITINHQTYRWAESPVDVAWHPIPEAFRIESGAIYRVWCGNEGMFRVPLGLESGEVWKGAYLAPLSEAGRRFAAEGPAGYVTERVPARFEDGHLVLNIDADLVGYWLYIQG